MCLLSIVDAQFLIDKGYETVCAGDALLVCFGLRHTISGVQIDVRECFAGGLHLLLEMGFDPLHNGIAAKLREFLFGNRVRGGNGVSFHHSGHCALS